MVSHIRQFSKYSYDVNHDTWQKARDIGTVKEDKARLSVHSALTAKVDKADNYSFKISKSVKDFGLVIKADGQDPSDLTKTKTISNTTKGVDGDIGFARVQILSKRGDVIADSSPNASPTLHKAYLQAQQGALSLDAGTYYLRVTRSNGVLDKTEVKYAIALMAGANYTQNYDNKEYPASTAPAQTAQLDPVSSMLTTASPNGTETTNVFDFLQTLNFTV